MQFKPTISEINYIKQMDDHERLHYFLTRTVEAEEIWALSDAQGWILFENGDQIRLQIWPYKQLAQAACETNTEYYPDATSLDHFIHTLLPHLIKSKIELEIMPTQFRKGVVVNGSKLAEQFESLLEAGDYYLEG